MKEIALMIAAGIFFIVSLLHLIRAVLKIEITVGRFKMPLWVSVPGFVVPLALALWMFSLAR